MEVHVPLDGRKIDDPEASEAGRIISTLANHDFGRAVDDSPDAIATDEHVVALLRKHEASRACQRVERGLRQRGKLELPVAVCKEGEHEEGQPIPEALNKNAQA